MKSARRLIMSPRAPLNDPFGCCGRENFVSEDFPDKLNWINCHVVEAISLTKAKRLRILQSIDNLPDPSSKAPWASEMVSCIPLWVLFVPSFRKKRTDHACCSLIKPFQLLFWGNGCGRRIRAVLCRVCEGRKGRKNKINDETEKKGKKREERGVNQFKVLAIAFRP